MRMQKLAILLGLSVVLALFACEQRQEQAQAPGQQPAVASKEPAPPQTGAQPAPAPDAARPAGEQAAQPPAGDQQVTGQQQAMAPPADQQATTPQPPPAGQTREAAEHMGQAPKVEAAPETITLQAKNGNVTLTHREHAGRMECQTCHGAGTPAKMPDFTKDKAHALCQGCHKEQGAGPTKCPDCHKKS